MNILISDKQYNEFCNNKSCEQDLKSVLNTPNTKNIFKNSIDAILSEYKKSLPKQSKQYKEDSQVLKKYFGMDENQIDKVMDIKMIYDDDGNWLPINKLNTNYSDLSVFISDILFDSNACLCQLVNDLKNNDYSYLLELSEKMVKEPKKYFEKYLKDNFEKYTLNNRKNTIKGNDSELFVIELLEKEGYNLVYLASEGSPIDTKLGIDMVMEKDNIYYKIQVKSVGSITKVDETPCDVISPGLKEKGGFRIFKKNIIKVNPNFLDYLVFVSGKKILVLKKYQPISIETVNPLKCIKNPKNDFPSNNTFIDLESVVFTNI